MARRGITAWLMLVAFMATAGRAAGDGKVFVRADAERALTSDQSAFLAFENGVETLVIETKAAGGGSDLGWVVPVPGEPEIGAATTGIFPTLRAITAPEIVQAPGYAGIVALLLFIGSILLAIGFLRRWNFAQMAAVVFVGILLVLFLLPSLGRARGVGGATAGVEAETRHIGAYEVTTLHGRDGGAVAAWLEASGYSVPAAARPVFDDYAAQGWRFVASRLRRDARAPDARAIHPLSVRFACAKPVYPMRLTGVEQASPLTLDLFVFGPSRAQVDGLAVRWCSPAAPAEPSLYEHPASRSAVRLDSDGKGVVISHAGLRSLIAGRGMLTRLVGTFAPGELSRDLAVLWDGAAPRTARAFTEQSAAEFAALSSASLLLATVMLLPLFRRHIRRPPLVLLVCVLTSLAVGVVFRIAAPAVPTVHRSSVWLAPYRLGELGMSFATRPDHWPPKPASEVLEEVRAKVEDLEPREGKTREGDAPGCWTLRDGAEGAEFVVYDLSGNEFVFPMFWER